MDNMAELYNRSVELLSKLVSIPSVNPGESKSCEVNNEERVASFLINYFRSQNYPYILSTEEILPGRPNAYIRTGDDPAKKILLLETHTDTVSTEQMTIDPFSSVVIDGKLYGRGSCDAKGQLVSMILGLEMAIKESNGLLPINVVLAATVDEEHLHRGVDRLVDQGFYADGAVAGEPTEMRLVTATKGSIRFKIRTVGKSAHTATPDEGLNALYIMSDVIQSIRNHLLPTLYNRTHHLCGRATSSVTIIKGGDQVNIVPDQCVIDVDRRLLPGEDWKTAYNEIRKLVYENVVNDFHSHIIFEEPYLIDPSLETSIDSAIVHCLSDVLKKNQKLYEAIGVPFGTDASKIALLGIPTVVFGPGSIQQAHTKNEFIEIKQVAEAAQIYRDLILNFDNYFEVQE